MSIRWIHSAPSRLRELRRTPSLPGTAYKLYSGEWGINTTGAAGGTTNVAGLANTVHWSPLLVGDDTTIDKISYQYTGSNTSSYIKILLYDAHPETSRPYKKLYESVSTVVQPTPVEAGFDIDFTLEAFKFYWAGIWTNSPAPSLTRMATGAGPHVGRAGSPLASSAYHSATCALTYDATDDAAPAEWTDVLVRRTTNWPVITYRIA